MRLRQVLNNKTFTIMKLHNPEKRYFSHLPVSGLIYAFVPAQS